LPCLKKKVGIPKINKKTETLVILDSPTPVGGDIANARAPNFYENGLDRKNSTFF